MGGVTLMKDYIISVLISCFFNLFIISNRYAAIFRQYLYTTNTDTLAVDRFLYLLDAIILLLLSFIVYSIIYIIKRFIDKDYASQHSNW